MALGDLFTADDQVEVNGLLLGPGTKFNLLKFTPWGFPDIRTEEVSRGIRRGVVSGKDTLGSRLVPMNVQIVASSKSDVRAQINLLTQAFTPSDEDTQLAFRLNDYQFFYYGRCRGADIQETELYGKSTVMAECRFQTTDPLYYYNIVNSVSTTIATSVGGLSFPLSFPMVFGSGSSGTVAARNYGNHVAPWFATLTGPLVQPRIEHVESGKSLSLTGLTIASGDYVEIDSYSRSILLNGTASRYSALSSASRWFELAVGTNTLRLTAASGAGSMSFSWRHAFI